MSLRYSEDSEAFDQAARDVLLKYYASKSTTHGEYVISLFIGLFAFIQIRGIFSSEQFQSSLVFSLVVGIFPTLLVYLLARTMIWGILSGYSLHTNPVKEGDAAIDLCSGIARGQWKVTYVHRLHKQCCAALKLHHPYLNVFVSMKMGAVLILLILYVSSVLFSYFLVFPNIPL